MFGSKHWQIYRDHAPAIWLLIGGLVWRTAIAIWLPPGFDESYYYLYTRHPAWSYFDHPLLVALSTGLGPWMTGLVSQFTIRIGTLLLYTGALLLLYLTSSQLFSKQAATFTLAIASIVPIFQLGFGVLTLPDSPLMFFWTAALYTAAHEFLPATPPSSYRPSYRLAIIGLLVGLACLGKYHGLALGFGLVGFCLTQRRYRSALLSPWTLIAVGLFLLAILPIVLWNTQHDWISLRYQSGRAVPDRGYQLLDLLVTFLVGVAYLFPTLGFPLWWASGRATIAQFQPPTLPQLPNDSQRQREAVRLILWLSLPLMLTFTLMGGYRPILPTWPMPGFWGASLLLGQWTARRFPRSPRFVRRWLWGTGIVVNTLLLLVLLHLTIGIFQKPSQYALGGGFLAPNSDASTQLIDIRQLRQGLEQSPQLRSALQQTDFLFANDLFLAGQVGMAVAPLTDKPITCFNQDLRGFAFWSTAQEWVGHSGLYFVTAAQSTDVAQYRPYFDRIEPLGAVPIRRGGAIVQTIQIYQTSPMLKPYPRPYGR